MPARACRLGRGPSSRLVVMLAFLLWDKPPGVSPMPKACHLMMCREIVCASGWALTVLHSTIHLASPVCPWAFASQALAKVVTCHRAGNVRRCGDRGFCPCCRKYNSRWSSVNMRKPGIFQKTAAVLPSACNHGRESPPFRFRIQARAMASGSRPIRGLKAISCLC